MLEHELLGLEAKATTSHGKRLKELARRFGKVRAYRTLFLNPDGSFKPEAATVIADLGHVAGLGISDHPAMSDGELRERAGRRTLALHILARIDADGSALRKLTTQIREME